MKRRVWMMFGAVALMLLCSAAAWGGASLDVFNGEKGEIRIAGGTAHIPVMKEAAARIMGRNPDIRISIAGGGSGVGIKQVGEGLVDIGNSGRKPTDKEIDQYDLVLCKWALDGVGIIVNPANTVRSLSPDQVRGIFAGTVTNWSEVGGKDGRINLYTRDESSGTREVFWEKGLKKGDVAGSANVVVSNGAMKAAISQDPHGVGYVSVGHIDQSVAAVAFDGVAPTMTSVKDGSYAIARGLFSNTKGQPAGLVKKFLDYLLGEEGQAIVAENGFVPVK
ncbi:MAG: phosphate ABC transporter substrate-binding protein [Thermodesulfobacteriota bacterium]